MKKIFWIAAVALAATPAFAEEDIMAGLYGNTLVITDETGVAKWHYTPDHKLTATLPGGKKIGGTWLINEGRLCETPDGQGSVCYQMGAKKVGDKWTGKPDMTLEVVKGVQ